MLAKVFSGTMVGLEPHLIEVEVALESRGLPSFNIVGLPDKAVNEAKDRVRAALNAAGLELPDKKVVVNLAPADLPKSGAAFDFAIALAILAADEIIQLPFAGKFFLGELALDGTLRPVSGVLPLCYFAKMSCFGEIFVPGSNSREASVVKSLAKSGEKLNVFSCSNLKQVLRHFDYRPKVEGNFVALSQGMAGEKMVPLAPLKIDEIFKESRVSVVDFADVKGQEQAKRALEIAAAGGHNVSLVGPPGAGKTMMARALVSIMPRLAGEEALEVSKIYSVAGLLSRKRPFLTQRPFRSPHHTTSRIGLIGGGSVLRPGEISLAHRGVLFLDEFPELPRHVKESLRQPLEDGVVSVSRASGVALFPAKFILVAASNPCPCGHWGDYLKKCRCSPFQIKQYRQRLSGPILDRIDLHVEVPAVPPEKLGAIEPGQSSSVIAERVQKARALQEERFANLAIFCNAEMSSKQVEQYCKLDRAGEETMMAACRSLGLSARAFFRVRKVARTIADLKGLKDVSSEHITEALQYRPREEGE